MKEDSVHKPAWPADFTPSADVKSFTGYKTVDDFLKGVRIHVQKKAVNLYLNEAVCKEAKEAALNLSIVAENAVKEAINRPRGAGCQNAADVVVRY